MADRLGIESIDREARTVVLKFRPQANLDPVRLVALVRSRPDLTLVPPAALSGFRLEEGRACRCRRPVSGRAPAASARLREASARTAAPSWWTARAREGTVKPGFSKEEILKPAKEDPRTPGGVFERVGGVLSELLDQR